MEQGIFILEILVISFIRKRGVILKQKIIIRSKKAIFQMNLILKISGLFHLASSDFT